MASSLLRRPCVMSLGTHVCRPAAATADQQVQRHSPRERYLTPQHHHSSSRAADPATGQSLTSAVDLSSPRYSGGKRSAPDDIVVHRGGASATDVFEHKRQRREESRAGALTLRVTAT
ncbi:hypothetical protein GQ600_4244 [Phytophthora cactorum]|nr:hypothetical protein GQ600_4244 [Phytophthora cactorum]